MIFLEEEEANVDDILNIDVNEVNLDSNVPVPPSQ